MCGCALDGLADIVQLQVDEDLLSLGNQFANELHPGGSVKLQADFVERCGIAERMDEGTGIGGRLEVQRDDQRRGAADL